MKFEDSDRVKVKPHFWWPNGATGTVSLPPEYVNEALDGDVEYTKTQRTVAGINQILTSVWIEFDKPAMDCSDDGPYVGGEVSIEYLEKIDRNI